MMKILLILLSVSAAAIKFKQGRTGTTIELCNEKYLFHERIDTTRHRRTKVYRAEDVATRKIVAIKVGPEILQAELEILDAIKPYPYLISYICVEETFLVMEYCAAGTLVAFLKENGPLAASTAWNFLMQLTSALETLSKLHIAHRDLQPSNLLLTLEGEIKITDFSSAGFIQRGSYGGPKKGVAPYQAPEVYLKKHQTEDVDLWSLGIIFYEMLTNEVPFTRSEKKGAYQKELSLFYKSHQVISLPDNIPTTDRIKTAFETLLNLALTKRCDWFQQRVALESESEHVDKR